MRSHSRARTFVWALLAGLGVAWCARGARASVAPARELKVEFTGLRSGKGYLAVTVFDESAKEAFPRRPDEATKKYWIKLDGRTSLSIDVPDLGDGKYAIAVLHDEDGNGKLRTGLFGIPLEGFGFSGNPTVYFGPPSFAKSQVQSGGTDVVEIRLKYF